MVTALVRVEFDGRFQPVQRRPERTRGPVQPRRRHDVACGVLEDAFGHRLGPRDLAPPLAPPPGAGPSWPLPLVRLRPARDARPVPRVRYDSRVKRLARILLNAGSDFSLLLLVLVIVLWARSYRGGDRIGRSRLAGEWGSPYPRPARMVSSVPGPTPSPRAPDEPEYSPVRVGPGGTLERDGLVSSSGRLYVSREAYHVGGPAHAVERVVEGL